MYVYLNDQGAVVELIPDEHPVFPGIPIEKRYSQDFIQKLIHVPNDTEVRQNWLYDPESEAFSPPPELVPPEIDPGPEDPGPALSQRVEALEAETAALMGAIERGLSL